MINVFEFVLLLFWRGSNNNYRRSGVVEEGKGKITEIGCNFPFPIGGSK